MVSRGTRIELPWPPRAAVFVSFPLLPAVRELIARRSDAMFSETGRTLSAQELLDAAPGRDVLMITATDRIDRSVVQRLPQEVRAIATYSVGHEHIDLLAAAERGLVVLNTPGVLTDAVAELGIFLMIGAARRGTESIQLLRSRAWQGWSPVQLPGVQLSGRRLGVFGMGRIGIAIARLAQALGMRVHYTRHGRLPAGEERGAVYHADAEELLSMSDVLLIASPLTAETRRFLDSRRIDRLPHGAIVVNVARGDIVDDDALIAALSSGRVGAAGLDVFANEPHVDARYFDLPNVFMTPHIGSSTFETRVAMARALLDGLDALARGERPANRLI